ncbi:hypothetical protein Q7P37_001477 [Cladosporium fusiforme]
MVPLTASTTDVVSRSWTNTSNTLRTQALTSDTAVPETPVSDLQAIETDPACQKDANGIVGITCGDVVHAPERPGKIGSASCFKNDDLYEEVGKAKAPSDEAPVGTRIVGIGRCVCDWPMLNELVLDFLTKALPAVGDITCKAWFTAITFVVKVGINSIPGLGPLEGAAISIAAQASEVMLWTYSNPEEALKHYTGWLQNPSGSDSTPVEETEQPSASLMDSMCGNKYTTEDAEKVFNGFQFAADFAFAPRLFSGSGKSWPPPFARGSGSLVEALDFIKSLGKKKGDNDNDKPKPTQPEPTQPKPSQIEPTQPKPTQPAPTQPDPTQPEPTQPSPSQPELTQPEPAAKPTLDQNKDGDDGDKPQATQPDLTRSKPTDKPTQIEPTDKPKLGKGHGHDDYGKPTITEPARKDKPAEKPTTTAPPENTKKPQSSQKTTDKHHECKRGTKGCAVTSYIVNQMIPNEKVIPVVCPHKLFPQACAHYHSAIYEGKAPAKLTCSESHFFEGRKWHRATYDWYQQHKNKVWRDFTATSVMDHKGATIKPKCQADEYPPAYFMTKGLMTQFIRWIPEYDNGGAGQLWRRFCKEHDGNVGNAQRVNPKYPSKNKVPNTNTLTWGGGDVITLPVNGLRVKKHTGKDQTTTTTSIWDKATYTRAVFSMAFDYRNNEKPSKQNNWYLQYNGCWPEDIIPEDPGFALMTSDKWYDDHLGYPKAKASRTRYNSAPSAKEVVDAQDRRKRNSRGKTRPPRAVGAEKLELHEGRLVARDIETNATRPLTDEEIQHHVEVVPCQNERCSAELHGRELDPGDLFITAIQPPSTPSVNHNAAPTLTPVQTMRTEIKPQKRTNVSLDLPAVTN